MDLRVRTGHGKSEPYLVNVHGSSTSGDIMYLNCGVTLRDLFIEGLCEFTGRNPSC